MEYESKSKPIDFQYSIELILINKAKIEEIHVAIQLSQKGGIPVSHIW